MNPVTLFQRNVIILSDNFPREKFAYLLCVVTGTRVKAGTADKVGVRMWGDFAESRVSLFLTTVHGK